jgi:hypothetical protein
MDNLEGGAKLANIRRFMQNNEDSDVLDELVRLANIQDERVLAMRAEERRLGFTNPRLDTAIRLHVHILLSIQRMRFDLGLDEYKRGIPQAQTAESAAEEQRQLYEALKVAEEIFARRLGTRDVVDVATEMN